MNRCLPLLAVLLLPAACDDGVLGQPADGDQLVYTPDWDGVVAMAEDHCVVCHSPGGSAEFLVLPDGLAADVNLGAGNLVVPGDPAGSRYWRVIADELIAGDPGGMPLGAPLGTSQIDHVRLWILDGAQVPATDDTDGDGVTAAEGDCDDSDPTVFPGADEVCDGVDNDCDTVVDGPTSLDASSWYADGDGDGYGTGEPVVDCDPPAGHAAEEGDCDDASDLVYPGAPETDCTDPTDYNCDGVSGAVDGDGDGFPACEDCDETDPLVNPGVANDGFDGVDNDCDGTVDEDAIVLSHATHIQPIWDANCTGTCHANPAPSGGLNLTSGYTATVNVPSDDVPSMDLVEPGDPGNSYLWHKLNGTQATVGGTGNQMPASGGGPFGGGSLSPLELLAIEQWIATGALP